PPRDLSKTTKAENYDDYNKVKIVEESRDSDYAVGKIGQDSWIAFRDADFGSGVSQFNARIASKEKGGKSEIRLDSPDGKLAGPVTIPRTGGLQNWKTVEATTNMISGKHDVYLVFDGEFRIDSFDFVGMLSLNNKMNEAINDGNVTKPLSKQLSNKLKQAEHHFNKGHNKQGKKHLEDFLKHLNRKGSDRYITEDVKDDLEEAVNIILETM